MEGKRKVRAKTIFLRGTFFPFFLALISKDLSPFHYHNGSPQNVLVMDFLLWAIAFVSQKKLCICISLGFLMC
jgi:hypothetical protein